MKVIEYRIVLPMTVEEYQKGLIYTMVEMSKENTGGGEGVETVSYEKFTYDQDNTGIYTYRVYHMKSKLPTFVKMIVPQGSLQLHEQAWAAYPKIQSQITNPGFLKERFMVKIDSIHLPGLPEVENALELPVGVLEARKVVNIDIANDPLTQRDLRNCSDPKQCCSLVTGRGPLQGNWIAEAAPIMTAYKLITVDFKIFGIQQRMENLIQNTERRLLTIFHRNMFCYMDQWFNTPLEDLIEYERVSDEEINHQRTRGNVGGISADDS